MRKADDPAAANERVKNHFSEIQVPPCTAIDGEN